MGYHFGRISLHTVDCLDKKNMFLKLILSSPLGSSDSVSLNYSVTHFFI
jgi:hypothetical protein